MSELLAKHAGVGVVEARGGFTIDPEKAREKLRHYQLAEPQRYVLLLVEAAFSSGAERLEFEIDSDDLHLRFGGEHFAYEQLENIYGSLFQGSSTELDESDLVQLRGLQQLAYALNSAMALNPRFARVVSVGEDGSGTALELRPDAPDDVERVEGLPPGNAIHVKERFRPGMIIEFFRGVRGQLSEVALLREHCRWSRREVVVNGELISGPIEFDECCWARAEVVDGEQPVGAVGLWPDAGEREVDAWPRAQVQLCSNGVLVEEIELEGVILGLRAVVDSPSFGKDVSQTKLLRDANYERVVDAVKAAGDELVAQLADALIDGRAPAWAEQLLLAWLERRPRMNRRRLGRELERDERFARVAAASLWPVVGGASPLTTRELIEARGALRHTEADFEFAPVDVPFVLHVASVAHADTLEHLFDDRLQDYTATLERELERQRARLEFMNRRQLPELDGNYYLARAPIRAELGDQGEIRGELGLTRSGGSSWARLVHEGCLLRELALDAPLPGVELVVQAPLQPNHDYDDASPNEALALALVASLAALVGAVEELAQSSLVAGAGPATAARLREYVAEVCAGETEFVNRLLHQFGFSHKQARRELRELRRGKHGALASAVSPVWTVHARARGEAVELEPTALERALLYPYRGGGSEGGGQGGLRSLLQLAERRAEGERFAWLERGTSDLPALEREVLLLTKSDRVALRELLGSDALEPYAERVAWLRRREAFLAAAPVEPDFALQVVLSVPFGPSEGERGLRGALGLREFPFTAAKDGRTPVAVHYLGRPLRECSIELPLPGLVAWVDGDEDSLELSSMFDGLRDPSAQLRPPLLDALDELLSGLLARARQQTGGVRLQRFEWWFLAMVPALVLRVGGLERAYVQMRRELELDAVIEELAAMFELLERYPGRDISRALGRLRGRNQPVRANMLANSLRRPTRKLSADERALAGLRRRLLPLCRELLALPLFRAWPLPGRTISLDTLALQVAADAPVSWVPEDFRLESRLELDFTVLSFDPIEQRLVENLLGDSSLELVSDWLIGRARFERRRTISEIRVPHGATLVSMALELPGVRGELGIAMLPPDEATRTKVRVFLDARQVSELSLPAAPLAMIGALEFDELELDPSHQELSDEARRGVRLLVEQQADALIEQLVDSFSEFSGELRTLAAAIVRELLFDWPPGNGRYAARAAKKRQLFKRVAALPVFSGARKPWSAEELADASARGRLATLDYRRPSAALPEGPVVILDHPQVKSILRTLYGDLRPLEPELERAREIAAAKAKAKPWSAEPPDAALVSLELVGEGLSGKLWLPAARGRLAFGDDGLVIETRPSSRLVPVDGAVSGPRLRVAKDWSRIILTRSQENLLERRACELWGDLIEQFTQVRREGVPNAGAKRERLEAMREQLELLFLRLHEHLGAGRKSKRKRKKRKRKGGNRYERLYDRAWKLPLLQLQSGRFISAETAERERPVELAPLKLWTGPSAEELAHQRAVERREAERARERERERQQKREAKRKREEAEAREREAKRRRKQAKEAKERARREAAEREAARAKAQQAEVESKSGSKSTSNSRSKSRSKSQSNLQPYALKPLT